MNKQGEDGMKVVSKVVAVAGMGVYLLGSLFAPEVAEMDLQISGMFLLLIAIFLQGEDS